MIQFTQNLKRLRESHGLTRQELADLSGISSAAIGYYETGKREPQASTLVSIATALHISVDELLGYHVDDFDRAAALFHEATGETATLKNGEVYLTGTVSKQKWAAPISKAAFIQAINTCIETFNSELRPRLTKDALINKIDEVYQKENKMLICKAIIADAINSISKQGAQENPLYTPDEYAKEMRQSYLQYIEQQYLSRKKGTSMQNKGKGPHSNE